MIPVCFGRSDRGAHFIFAPHEPSLILVELAAKCALVRIGGQKKLALGMRKGHGPLIAPFRDDIGIRRQLPLQLDEKRPHLDIAGDEILHGERIAFVGDVDHVDAGGALEELR